MMVDDGFIMGLMMVNDGYIHTDMKWYAVDFLLGETAALLIHQPWIYPVVAEI
jgi:hypothetical protein